MASLFVNVQVAGSAPLGGLAAGPSLAVTAWAMTRFLRSPHRGDQPPSGAADATGTTDASGNVTLTVPSTANYWLRVIDARGVPNWFPSTQPGAGTVIGDRFICTIPWSTPTLVTKPLDSRGGDTMGGPSGIQQWAPRTHIHEVPSLSVPKSFLNATISGSFAFPHSGALTTLTGFTVSSSAGSDLSLSSGQQFNFLTDGVYLAKFHMHDGGGAFFGAAAKGIAIYDNNPDGQGGQLLPIPGDAEIVDWHWVDTVGWPGAGNSLTYQTELHGASSDVTISGNITVSIVRVV